MADQISDHQPQMANSNQPFPAVVPADWGKVQVFRKLVTNDPSLILTGLIDKEGNSVTLSDQTMELTGILIQNFEDTTMWWGDVDVEPGFGAPIRARDASVDATIPEPPGDNPGYAMLTGVDPAECYVMHGADPTADLELVVMLFGKFIKAEADPSA